MPDNILFYVVFLSQIFLISFYFPKKIQGRVKHVFKTYPPEEYPKLYPKPLEHYRKGLGIYRTLNQIILGIGLIVMFSIAWWDFSRGGNIIQEIPFVYWMLQILPILIMEISGFAYFKLMRKADQRTTRKADLQPRRLFDFISPITIGLAVFSNIVCLLFFNSLEPFQFNFSNDTLIILLSLSLSNFLYIIIIFWNLYGKKLDPHQASKDRIHQIKVTIKSLVYMSIGAAIFLMITKGINVFDLDHWEPTLMSIFLQFTILIGLGSMLRNIRIENLDFEVYKEEVSAS